MGWEYRHTHKYNGWEGGEEVVVGVLTRLDTEVICAVR